MLRLVATPIGNLDDLPPRALRALQEADVIACEDTRRTRQLLAHFEVPSPDRFLSYREQTEVRAGEQVIALLEEGRNVVLCTDGGYPGISDPGFRLTEALAERGMDFEVIPGASAVPMALLLSGLPTSSYVFKGFPPRKPGPRARFFGDDGDRPHTMIVFESPFRVTKCLQSAREALGDRKAAVCCELTKKFERVSRGYLSELIAEFDGKKVKGEVTIVVAGNHPKFTRPDSD